MLVVEIVGLTICSFLVATLGYDKVMQTIKQFLSRKNGDGDSDDKTDNK